MLPVWVKTFCRTFSTIRGSLWVDSVVRSAVCVAALGILDSMSASGWNVVYPARTSFVGLEMGYFQGNKRVCMGA